MKWCICGLHQFISLLVRGMNLEMKWCQPRKSAYGVRWLHHFKTTKIWSKSTGFSGYVNFHLCVGYTTFILSPRPLFWSKRCKCWIEKRTWFQFCLFSPYSNKYHVCKPFVNLYHKLSNEGSPVEIHQETKKNEVFSFSGCALFFVLLPSIRIQACEPFWSFKIPWKDIFHPGRNVSHSDSEKTLVCGWWFGPAYFPFNMGKLTVVRLKGLTPGREWMVAWCMHSRWIVREQEKEKKCQRHSFLASFLPPLKLNSQSDTQSC